MYIYTVHVMPGHKAKFDGDTSVKYKVRRRHIPASADQKTSNVDIRTDLDFSEATELAKKFNDKEQEAKAIKHEQVPDTESLKGHS